MISKLLPSLLREIFRMRSSPSRSSPALHVPLLVLLGDLELKREDLVLLVSYSNGAVPSRFITVTKTIQTLA